MVIFGEKCEYSILGESRNCRKKLVLKSYPICVGSELFLFYIPYEFHTIHSKITNLIDFHILRDLYKIIQKIILMCETNEVFWYPILCSGCEGNSFQIDFVRSKKRDLTKVPFWNYREVHSFHFFEIGNFWNYKLSSQEFSL